MDSRPDWVEDIDQPAMVVLASNHLSKMARRANHITEEVTKIRQRVDKMIQTFERTQGGLSHGQSPDMEIVEDVEDLENVLHDLAQRKRYQQKLTVFIVGYEETCGQRRHLLTQLQEFFSIYSNLNEEGDQKLVQSTIDLDGIAERVTQAVRSSEAAMSRLADIHAGIMSCVNQTMSARAQDKRKPSDDRGRKKLEKVLDQARQDIGQLTDQLLQAEKDLTLKDQQFKELMTQNERRFLEIEHVKSQLEVTKKSLQILQDETAMQRSLLEAELRRREGQLKNLEDQKTAKHEQLTDASTQWEILNSVSEDEIVPAITEEEENIKDFMDKATQTVFTDLTSEHNKVWSSEMELQVSYTDKNATENDKPVSCLQVFDECTSDMTLSAVVKNHNSVTVSVNTSSEISQPSETTAPIHDGNMLPLEPHIIYTTNDSMDSNISVAESEKPCDVSQAGTETNSISYKFEENETSNEEISDHLNAPHVTESMDESTISQTVEQITHVMPLLSMPSNESHVDEPCQEPYESNYHMLSVALEEEHFSPIVERQLPSLTGSSNNQVTVHLGTEKSTSPGSSVMPTEDTDFVTFIPKPNKDSFLLILSPENAENTHFELYTKVEEGVKLIPSASNTTELHSSSLNLNNNSNLADSHSHQTDSLFPVTSPALHSVDTKMEDKVHIESPATPADTIHYTVNDPVGDIVDPTGSSVLYGDIEEIEMKKATKTPHAEQGNVPNEKRLRSEDSSAEMWDILQGLHTCVQEIRDLLMNNGFSSLVDGLTADIKDCNGDEISSNITQLKHLPAVLHSLLQSASESDKHKQAADEPAQVDDITHRSMETQTDREHLAETKSILRSYAVSIQVRIMSRITPIQHQCNSASTLQASIFTHLDEEHNRRILQRSSDQGKIPLHVYQEANRAMSEYRRLRQERLRSLASGYVQYISWNTAENHLQRQCLTRPHIIPALSKIKVLKHQVFLRWKKKREQSQEEKLNLSISLHQILQGVQEDSGIFLIKPVLSWSGRSSMQKGHSQILSHYRPPQRSRFPPLDQGGILCCGKAPPSMPKEWKTMNTDTEIQPVVVTPKLLEMDVRRYLCKECSVSRICSSPAGLLLRNLPLQKCVSFKQISSLPAM